MKRRERIDKPQDDQSVEQTTPAEPTAEHTQVQTLRDPETGKLVETITHQNDQG